VYTVIMMRCTKMFTVLALVAPLAVGVSLTSAFTASEVSADVEYTDLCGTTRYNCPYASVYDSPVLRADVCWDGETVILKGASDCSSGRPYHVTWGVVLDSRTLEVQPIEAVPDTCDANYCVSCDITPGTILEDGVACCNPKTGTCTNPDANGVCTYGDVTWCKKLEDNGDGTVTCHE
jgi:hypothetical protein